MLAKIARKFVPLQSQAVRSFAAGNTAWGALDKAPADPILGINVAFQGSKHPNKQLLGVGAFRTNEGKPYILPCVTRAEEILLERKTDHEYSGIDGVPGFRKVATAVAFGGDSEQIASGRIAACQSLSGTGSLRVGFEFLRQWWPNKSAKIMVSDPTWPTHRGIAVKAGFETVDYRYFNRKERNFDINGMLEDLTNCEDEQIVILHSCAHNPTGQDPTHDQWKQILEVCKTKGHFCGFDSAYQGFASGDLDRDAYSIRLFAEHTDRLCVFQSFAKNFGLYGERCGNLNFLCTDAAEADIVSSRMKQFARPMYSNPPIHGAKVVEVVLNDAELTASWHSDLTMMSARMLKMRTGIVSNLKSAGSKVDWSHITNQIGMFAFTGLSVAQVESLRDNEGLYMTLDGRISICGLNTGNLEYIANALHRVTKDDGLLG